MNTKIKNAVMIGSLCSISYFSVYIVRNILGTVTPQMLESGVCNELYIGRISSLYFIFYAVGQLLNGMIGDRIHAKWMLTFGLLGAGCTNLLFTYLLPHPSLALLVYALTGFFLSMIYGPMTKVVAENTEPHHATRCSLGYTFASFFGSPTAGLLATFLAWQSVFFAGSAVLAVMAAVVCFSFTLMERRGIVRYGQYQRKERITGGVRILLKNRIVKFSLVSILTGVVRTSVVFWLPQYTKEHLGFSASDATLIFTVATLAISASAFIAVFTYERLGRDMDKTVLLMFCSATVFFLLTFFLRRPLLNVTALVLAIISSNGAASMLWSRYCPGLRDTGMVSSATGFLDFLSYMAAAVANLIFANAASAIGWSGLILVWGALMLVGVAVALPWKRPANEKV